MSVGMSGENFHIVIDHVLSFSVNVGTILALVILLVLIFLLKMLLGGRRRV